MGAVWAATHTSLGRRAAVKLLAPALASNREYVSRFLSEARIVNDVRHPNIVDIFDFVELQDPPRVACIMELLDGPTLADQIKQGPLPPPKALQITLQLVDALVQVHAAGVVHRDLKPQNIIVISALEADLSKTCAVKILDFGIAKQDAPQATHKTATGSIMGTPAYMAPEQVAASAVSPATDLYALAEILFEMVSAQRLYRGDNLSILRQKMMSEAPNLDLPKHMRDVQRIEALLRPCLAPDPQHRPALSDFGQALAQLLEEWGETTTHDQTWPTLADVTGTDPDTTRPDAQPGLSDVHDDEPVANTQMFYEQILEDIDEAAPKYVPPPEPSAPQLRQANLHLGTPSDGHEYGVEGPKHDPQALKNEYRVAEERNQALQSGSMPIAIIQGKKTATKQIPWLWIAMGLAGASIAAGALLMPNVRNQAQAQIDLLADNEGVQEASAQWKKEFAPFTGSAKDLTKMGLQTQREDSRAAYARARDYFKKALIVDPEDAQALAHFLENEAIGYSEQLAPQDRGKYLSWLSDLQDTEGAARRAEALLTFNPQRSAEISQSLLQSASTIDRVAGAALILHKEPSRALAALQRHDLSARGLRIRALAEASAGAYGDALGTLKARLQAEPNNGLVLAQVAHVYAQVGEHKRAELLLAKASRQSPPHLPTILAHGIIAARLRKTAEAAKSLQDVAQARLAPPALRAEAYARWADLAVQQQAFTVADERATEGLKWVPQHVRASEVQAEARLQLGRPLAAMRTLEPALAAHPKAPGLNLLNAALLLAKSAPAEALAAMEVAAQARPHDPRIATLCAIVAHAAQDPARAQVHLSHLLELDPRYVDHTADPVPVPNSIVQASLEALRLSKGPRAIVEQGVLQYHVGRIRQAKAALLGAKTDPLAQLYLAQVAVQARATTTARAILKRAPSSPAISLVRGRVGAVRRARVEAEADFAEAGAAPALARTARIEAAQARGDVEGLKAQLRPAQADPWLRRALYRLGAAR